MREDRMSHLQGKQERGDLRRRRQSRWERALGSARHVETMACREFTYTRDMKRNEILKKLLREWSLAAM